MSCEEIREAVDCILKLSFPSFRYFLLHLSMHSKCVAQSKEKFDVDSSGSREGWNPDALGKPLQHNPSSKSLHLVSEAPW